MVKIDFEKLEEERRKQYEVNQIARQECISAGKHLGRQLKGLPCYTTGQDYYHLMGCSHCGYQYEQKMTKSERENFKKQAKRIVVKSKLETVFA
jgi:uncharacterized Fe-S cluster-containing MiaB family protein